eukprot:TRINITY_DN4945_c0_g2_i1.p1 TRINITY_DN4945_c0_g2~~TRINITY_DN4945_c0_g2_i1.p1  ORF type:complete len:608 (-),score=128.50 TRINITY_DN4945_c0_g2_i1:56-1879(-)
MNIVLLIVLAVFFLSIAFFVIKKLVVRAVPPTSRSDDHEEDLYVKVIDHISNKQRIVLLFFNCQNLENTDLFSASDPKVEVYQRSSAEDSWRKAGETELISNELNPYFTKGVVLHYFNNQTTQLKFSVKDIDIHTKTDTITSDLIGEFSCPLEDLLKSPNTLTSDLSNPKKGKKFVGKINVVLEQITPTETIGESKKTIVHFNEVSVKGLPLGLPTFFQLFRLSGENRILVYQSEVQQSSFNPKWKSFNIRERKLNEPLIISLWKWNNSSFGSITFIGESTTTLEQLLANNNTSIDIIGRKEERVMATLIFQYCKIETKPIQDFKAITRTGFYTRYLNRYSYKDYFKMGLEIQTVIALDMTKESAVHHQSQKGGQPLIEQVIHNILSFLEPFDQDRAFTLYGYGAKPKNSSEDLKPFFPLNGNPDSPDCIGIEEAISCYKKNYSKYEPGAVSEAKPPNKKKFKKNDFYPVIQKILDECEEGKQSGVLTRKYYILLILVTGDDINLQESIKAIVEAAEYPISIVFIAIGEPSIFGNVGQLDADDHPLEIKSNPPCKAKRDIVQFVHVDPNRLKEQRVSRDYLEREIVAEIPAQVCSFMSMNFLSPKNI